MTNQINWKIQAVIPQRGLVLIFQTFKAQKKSVCYINFKHVCVRVLYVIQLILLSENDAFKNLNRKLKSNHRPILLMNINIKILC